MGETAQEVKAAEPIFSLDEKRRLVKSFINAFLRGRVTITLWDSKVVNMTTGKRATLPELFQTKDTLLDAISTACQVGNPPEEEIARAIDTIFQFIVSMRSGMFLQGEFLDDPEFETRLTKLEGRISSLEKLIEDLQQIWRIRGPP